MALKEGPYPVRKCPSVNQKFQAEFGVAKEEPDGPGLGLVILPGKHTPLREGIGGTGDDWGVLAGQDDKS